MILIGIVGGIGSGKSLVSEQFRRLGAEILDADRAGHEVLRDPEVVAAVRRRWGQGVIAPGGEVDRGKLAQIVFSPSRGPEELTYLEQITHPRIERRLRDRISRLKQAGDVRAVVLDAPVMFKAGWDRLCEKIVFIHAPRNVRLARVLKRGWTEAEFDAREAVQESLDFKRNRAHVIIDNSASPEETLAQVEHFWRSLFGTH